jgi:hypothetical protein
MAYPHAMFGEWYGPVYVPPIIAGAATQEDPLFLAPINCVLLGVAIVPQASVVGNTGTCKNLNLVDKGLSGIGAVEFGNLDLVTGEDLTAFDAKVLPVTATAGSDGHVLHAGDVVTLQTELVGGGVAIPGLLIYLALRENGV